MMSMSRKKCCVPGCVESGNTHQTLHLFPNPLKDRERFNQWVLAIGGNIIGLENEDIYKHRSVCHLHFEEKFCCRYNRLSKLAVPTLNIPGPLSLPKFTYDERRPLREHNYSLIASIHSASTSTKHSVASESDALSSEKQEKENKDPMELTTLVTQAPQHPMEKENQEKVVVCQVSKTVKKHVRVTCEEQKLYQKLIQARIKLSKCRQKIKKQLISLKTAKKLTSNPALLATMEKLPKSTKLLTMIQFRELKKKEKGRRFSLEEKILALSIFKQAPKGYRLLSKLLILPAPQTLAKLISQADLKPGINKQVFQQLKGVTKEMKTEEKLCVLLFDEMSLKANLSYNEKKDKVIGFVTDGQETIPEFADHAQVFMIRGLIKNYKQPVSYTFSVAATSGQQIAKQLKQIITKLQEADLIVVATVCDQGANNRLAIKLMLQEARGIQLKNGQEPKSNVILVNNQEVIPLYDPPHLIKCIRNNLLTKNLEYDNNGIKCTAKWEHLILLHKENPGYKGVRLIPKLTENHVLLEKVTKNKMKVKFSTQVFSRAVASTMGYLADKGVLPIECRETADVLLFFDDLFDSLNGSYNKKNERFAKPLLDAVTPRSKHHKYWTEAKQKLQLMKFVNPATRKIESVPTLGNWAWTLDGMQVLLKNLEKEYKITSVWMRHLNQDPLENFFGAVRSHGCRNTNPTPENFEGAFATLLINNMSSVHAPVGANCENDFCHNLYGLIVTDECKATTAPATFNFEKIPQNIVLDINTKKDPQIMAPLQYVSGYFIRNVKLKIFKSCQQCNTDVIASEGNEYIKYREYAGKRWLCSPTDAVVQCISAIQDITNAIIKECIDQNCIKEFIKTYLITFLEFDFLNCQEHKDDIIQYLVNSTSRFFLYNYCKDINKILNGKCSTYDDEDSFQMKAKKYYKKCFKRKNK